MGAEDIAPISEGAEAGRVEVDEQVYRTRDQLFIRYSIANLTQSPFRVTAPDISRPIPTERPVSLVSLRDHQLAPKAFSASRRKTGVPVLRAECASHDLAPGQKTEGHQLSGPAGDATHEFTFGRDQNGPLRVGWFSNRCRTPFPSSKFAGR